MKVIQQHEHRANVKQRGSAVSVRAATDRPPRRFLGWIGWAGADAAGRLILLSGSTMLLSRMTSPREFGVASLVLTIVAVAAVFVGAPFEEALTQLPRVRKCHLRAALAASWFIGALLFVLTLLSSTAIASRYQTSELATLLPVAMSSIFFSGHADIIASVARRRKRFNDMAAASLAGHVVGVVLSVVIAIYGDALWALVLQRVIIVVARAIILQWRIGVVVMPRWSRAPLAELARYASYSFLARLTDTLTHLVFNNVIHELYGVAALGQVNMAMRIVEPIRSAVTATGHNLAFSFFARAGADPQGRRQTRDQVILYTAFAIAPLFVGLAVVSPVLLPVCAGQGWNEASVVAVWLSLAGAVAAPSGLIFTAFSASGRPDLSFLSLIAGFAMTVATLACLAGFGVTSVGLSRVVGDGVRATIAVSVTPPGGDWPWRARLATLLPAWRLAAAMGLIVATLNAMAPGGPSLGRLAALIVAGVLTYGVLMAVFVRPSFVRFAAPLLRILPARTRPASI